MDRQLALEQIAKLDAIGMVWENQYTVSWNRYYAALSQYRQERGDLDVPADYMAEKGLCLGRFVSNLRVARALGNRYVHLTEEQLGQLDAPGMIWKK